LQASFRLFKAFQPKHQGTLLPISLQSIHPSIQSSASNTASRNLDSTLCISYACIRRFSQFLICILGSFLLEFHSEIEISTSLEVLKTHGST